MEQRARYAAGMDKQRKEPMMPADREYLERELLNVERALFMAEGDDSLRARETCDVLRAKRARLLKALGRDHR